MTFDSVENCYVILSHTLIFRLVYGFESEFLFFNYFYEVARGAHLVARI